VKALGLLAPFVLIGIGVLFVAFSGGAGRAREAYLTRGGGVFRVVVPLLYIGLGVAVPALIIAQRDEATGDTGKLAEQQPSPSVEHGKHLFVQTCASCHTLAAVNARGVTGPNLDQIGTMTPARVLSAIRIGGTGQNRMPSGLLDGRDAQDVAAFVSKVAGK
jgi:mono/diheme cytochrome c family protein